MWLLIWLVLPVDSTIASAAAAATATACFLQQLYTTSGGVLKVDMWSYCVLRHPDGLLSLLASLLVSLHRLPSSSARVPSCVRRCGGRTSACRSSWWAWCCCWSWSSSCWRALPGARTVSARVAVPHLHLATLWQRPQQHQQACPTAPSHQLAVWLTRYQGLRQASVVTSALPRYLANYSGCCSEAAVMYSSGCMVHSERRMGACRLLQLESPAMGARSGICSSSGQQAAACS